MELFVRDAVLRGPPAQTRDFATSVAAAFEDATGRHVNVWTSLTGGLTGHYAWGLPVDGHAEIVNNTMAAMADEAYLAKLEEGRDFLTSPAVDTLYRGFNGPDEDTSQVGSVVSVTVAEAAPGKLGDAVGWGLEVCEYGLKVTGEHTTLLGTVAGSFSTLTWMTIVDDAAAADAADRTLTSDEGYLKLIARGGAYFVAGSAKTQNFLRIA